MTKKTNRSETRIALGFEDAATATGLSKSFLRNAVRDPDPARRLKTVRVNRRRLIREEDLRTWFDTVARKDQLETTMQDQ